MGLTDTDRRMLPIAYEEAKAGFDEGGCPIGSVLAALSADFALLYSKMGRPSIAQE